MGITFNADEIFEMAEEIERNGAKFYREAAQRAADKQVKQMLLDMATMEDGHLVTFQQMREELSGREIEPTVFDPDNQAVMYLRTMAESHGYEGRVSPSQKLTGAENIEEILRKAISSEKESVVFYTALRDLVPPKAGRDKVDSIIAEELGHITSLLEAAKNLEKN